MTPFSQFRSMLLCAAAIAVVTVVVATPVRAHEERAAALPADHAPDVFKGIGIDQRLGTALSGDAAFHDETGAPVTLKHYFRNKPAILVFSYYECPMLCPLVLDGLVRSVKPLSLEVGRDFDVIVVSIDERDTLESARAKKAEYVSRYGRNTSSAGWHFLTGERPAIDTVTREAGFRFAFDEASNQFVHASGIFVLTPAGKIARVLYGVDHAPSDVRLALVEAGNGSIGSIVDQVLLYCYHYDPATGKYGLAIISSLRMAGFVTVLALVSYITLMLRRDRRTRSATEA